MDKRCLLVTVAQSDKRLANWAGARTHEWIGDLFLTTKTFIEKKNYSRKIEKHENFHKLLNLIKSFINK